MTVPRSLGPELAYLRVWHDNSGEGSKGSWYLDRVVVKDLQTGATSHFLCDDWLAVDEGDGVSDRVLPVAGTEELTSFGRLFSGERSRVSGPFFLESW